MTVSATGGHIFYKEDPMTRYIDSSILPSAITRRRRVDRMLIAISILALILTAYAVYMQCSRPNVDGDTNGDGRLNAVDLTMQKRHLIGTYDLTRGAVEQADWNGNGRIDQGDIDHWRDVILGVTE